MGSGFPNEGVGILSARTVVPHMHRRCQSPEGMAWRERYRSGRSTGKRVELLGTNERVAAGPIERDMPRLGRRGSGGGLTPPHRHSCSQCPVAARARFAADAMQSEGGSRASCWYCEEQKGGNAMGWEPPGWTRGMFRTLGTAHVHPGCGKGSLDGLRSLRCRACRPHD